jgi:hypothetical protein
LEIRISITKEIRYGLRAHESGVCRARRRAVADVA